MNMYQGIVMAILKMAASALLCATISSGCGGHGDGSNKGKIILAVIPKGTTHEFWKSIHAGAVKASREDSVEIIWKGSLKEDDREGQISVVEDFTSRGVSGIILAPLDDAALRQPVANAVRSGIPVVIIDSDLQGNDYLSFVATDNYLGGKLAGERMVELLGGKGKVIMLRYHEGSASTTKREQGFLDAVGVPRGIQVVSSGQYGGATTETAYKASENLIAPLKGADGRLTVDGIFTPNESTTFGMLRALQDGGYAGSVRFIGFDSSPKLVEALQNSQIDALVLQNPMRMGYLGVKIMVAHLRGRPIEKKVDTGVTLVTRDNMSLTEIKELLQPDLAPWLQ
jgi:ribose transport system substrate-binding protein